MNNEKSLVKLNSELMAAMSSGSLQIDVFKQEILVLNTLISGTSFQKLSDIDGQLVPGLSLNICRDAKNKHDQFAVSIRLGERTIGYIPREKNETIARMLDAGKEFFAKIKEREWEGNWLKIIVDIYWEG